MADGTLGMSKPCLVCTNKIKKNKNIRSVYYTNEEGILEKNKSITLETSHQSRGYNNIFKNAKQWQKS